MPRLKIGPREAELIADFLAVTEEESGEPARGDAAAGRALYEKSQCASCHYRGDSPLASLRYGAPEFRSPSARRRAPDLRYARSRMSLPQLRSWLSDPHRILPGTEMPTFEFTPKQLEDLVTFLSEALPEVAAAPRPAYKPRLLAREVHYPEVAQKLSRHLCFHCHSDMSRPGDQGPGNTGGFGYDGVSLDLATREGILRGVKRDGQFRGLPDRLEDGTPRLVASLLARHAELDGRHEPGVLGMPLGFPPIPDEEIDLIYTWIEQGAPE
jgi:cytochrome c2